MDWKAGENPNHATRQLRTPYIIIAALLVALIAAMTLLLGLPIEIALSAFGNPVSRIAIVALTISIATLTSLSIALFLEMKEHQQTIEQLEETQRRLNATLQGNQALNTTLDGLEQRMEHELDRMHEAMAQERRRIREHLHAHLTNDEEPETNLNEVLKP